MDVYTFIQQVQKVVDEHPNAAGLPITFYDDKANRVLAVASVEFNDDEQPEVLVIVNPRD